MKKRSESLAQLSLIIVFVIFFTSCSYTQRSSKKMVSLEKYEALEKKYLSLLGDVVPESPKNNFEQNSEKTVQKILKSKSVRTLDGSSYSFSKIARELRSLERMSLKIKKKHFGDAVLLAKELENSKVEQIRAQARFLFAEAMEKQGEAIIASQIYEEVAVMMPFSIYSFKAILKGRKIAKAIDDRSLLDRFSKLAEPFEKRGRI
ncbi:MAG: hypothetical protein CME61_04335 [Halobacteriovoraceae bacterium]|nr:hypothetical protein [Halobacteriovoraceae bacterium]